MADYTDCEFGKLPEDVQKLADMLLRVSASEGCITRDNLHRFARICAVPEDVMRSRAQELGLTPFCTDTDDAQEGKTFDTLDNLVQSEGFADIYDFLYRDTQIERPRNMGCAQHVTFCRQYAEDPEYQSGRRREIIEQCLIIFADDETKREYDESQNRKNIRGVLNSLKGKTLDDNTVNDAIEQLTQYLDSSKASWRTFLTFCREERLRIDYKGVSGETVCMCGEHNIISDEKSVCSSCARPLVIRCPVCGELMETGGLRPCRCGFSLGDACAARTEFVLAAEAFAGMDFDEMRRRTGGVSVLRRLGAAEFLSDMARDAQNVVGDRIRRFREAYESKNLFRARQLYTEIRQIKPIFRDEEAERVTEQSIREAESLLKRVEEVTDTDEKFRLIAKAFDLCRDIQLSGINIPKPHPVELIRTASDSNGRVNHIRWEHSTESGVRYVLVRNTRGEVQSVTDGEIIYRGECSAYSDRAISGGVAYYYNVFVERAGIYSDRACGDTSAVINAFEASNVRIEENDRSVTITWDDVPQGARTEIYVTDAQGTQRHIASVDGTSYICNNLQNDSKYVFKVAYSYTHDFRTVTSQGVWVTAIPYRAPEPVMSGRIVSADGRRAVVWDRCDCDEVIWYLSAAEPQDGVVTDSMTRIGTSPMRTWDGEEGVYLEGELPDGAYLVPVSVRRKKSAVGRALRIGRDEVMNIREVRPVNGRLYVFADIPADADEIVAFCSDRGFASDAGDVSVIPVRTDAKYCRADGAVILGHVGTGVWYISLYARFGSVYTPPAHYVYSNVQKTNITYSVKAEGKIFGKSVNLTVWSDSQDFYLPELSVVSSAGAMPIFDTDGIKCASIPAQRVTGTLTVNLPKEVSHGKNTYLRVFFADSKELESNTLSAAVGSVSKIN